MPRAKSVRVLTAEDASRIRGMLLRGDVQSDIAQYHSVNQGRIHQIRSGRSFKDVPPMGRHMLPPRGPYAVVTKLVAENATVGEIALRGMRSRLKSLLIDVEKELSKLGGDHA